MKKLTALAIAMGLGVSTSVSASNVYVPELKGGFNIGVEGNYLRPSNSQLGYAYNHKIGDPDVQTKINNIEPNHQFGFGVNIGYMFPGTANDINVRYNRFSKDYSKTTRDKDGRNGNLYTVDSMYGNATRFIGDENSGIIKVITDDFKKDFDEVETELKPTSVTGKLDLKVDDLAVTLGQQINFNHLVTRFYAGLGYIHLNETLDINTAVEGEVAIIEPGNIFVVPLKGHIFEKNTSKFTGIGPVLGLNGNYNIYGGFGIVANLEAGLYVGNTKASYRANSIVKAKFPELMKFADTQTYQVNLLDIPERSSNRVVPKLSAALGLEYKHQLNNNYFMAVEGGYKMDSYINAKDRYVFNVNDGNFSRQSSTYNLDGIYLRLKLLAA